VMACARSRCPTANAPANMAATTPHVSSTTNVTTAASGTGASTTNVTAATYASGATSDSRAAIAYCAAGWMPCSPSPSIYNRAGIVDCAGMIDIGAGSAWANPGATTLVQAGSSLVR
jgi:hypothetical protein